MTTKAAPIKNAHSNGASAKNKTTVKGLVYRGPGKIEYKFVTKPKIENPTDALIKIVKTTICGTDLGILHGKTPSVKPGTTLGHEGIGIIEEVGNAVRNFKKGDRVLHLVVPASIAKNKCTDNVQKSGFLAVLGVTNGKLNQSVLVNDKTDNKLSVYGKLGFDKQLNEDLRIRLTGSIYSNQGTFIETFMG